MHGQAVRMVCCHIIFMASQLAYPLVSCGRLCRLMQTNSPIQLLYFSDDTEFEPIPGSISVPSSALKDVDLLQKYLRGIEEDSVLLVCYEREGLRHVCSAWWLLVSKGWRLVSVLEGGLMAWRQYGDMPVFRESPPHTPSMRSRKVSHTLKVSKIQRTQELTTDKSSLPTRVYINPDLLLKSGQDLAEPKLLKWILMQAGTNFEDECEAVVYGPDAHLVLLILCSLGKRSIRQGVELTEELDLYEDGDDLSLQPQRKVSIQSDIESIPPANEVVVDHMSGQHFAKYTNTLTFIGSTPTVQKTNLSEGRVCRCEVF